MYLPFDKYLKINKKYFLPYDNRGNKSQMNWTNTIVHLDILRFFKNTCIPICTRVHF